MRRSLLFLAPVLATALLVACESEDTSFPGVEFTPDAGTFDGAVPPSPPTPAKDASAPDVDAGPQPVTVQILTGVGPAAGKLVFFHDAAGAVIGTATTGADGKAVSTGDTPAQVTALLGGPAPDYLTHRLVTWTAVEAGDVLVAQDVGKNVGAVALTYAGFDGAEAYFAGVGPTSRFLGQGGGTIPLFSDEARPKSVVLARAEQNGRPAAYAFVKDVALPAMGAGPVSVTLPEWVEVNGSNVSVERLNTPAGAGFAGTTLIEVAGTQAFPNPSAMFDGTTGYYRAPTGFADAYESGAFASMGGARFLFAGKRAKPESSVTVDMANALPTIDTVDRDTTDQRRPKISWTSSAPLTTTDGGSVLFTWSDPATEDTLEWSFIVPPTATEVTAPALPKEADAWLPPTEAGTVFFGPAEPLFVETDLVADYATFRAAAAALIPSAETADGSSRGEAIVLPADGAIRATWCQGPFVD